MIDVDRLKVPAPQSLMKDGPDALGRLRTFYTQDLRKRAQETPPFETSVWMAPDVRRAITQLFGGRCAFCESLIEETARGLVGHFRPIERAAQFSGSVDRDHYWWLAYSWENLFAICAQCDDSKGQRFPVSGRRADAGTTGLALKSESPLLLDPCMDQPEKLFKYLADGAVEGIEERAGTTIECFGLNRPLLVAARAQQAEDIKRRCAEYIASGDPKRVDENHFVRTLLEQLGEKIPFVGLSRQLVRREYMYMTSFTLTRPVVAPARATFKKPQRAPVEVQSPPVVKAISHKGAVWLDRIEIENFKALRRVELSFPRDQIGNQDEALADQTSLPASTHRQPWLMLLGENGVGKSSVLKAIALALMPDAQRRELFARQDDWVTRGARARSGLIRLSFTTGSEPLEVQFSRNSRRVVVKGELPAISVLGYGSTRLLPAAEKGRRPKPERIRIANLFNAAEPLRDAEHWIANPKSVPARDFNLLAMSLKNILLLGEQGRIMRRDGALSARLFDKIVPIRELSDGYQSVLALVSDMILNLSHATFDMQGVEGVVLLDELEVHLHPRWKIMIVSDLRQMFPRVRFIATTHDPLCVQGLAPGELNVMTRDSKTSSVRVEQVDVPSGLRADQVLTGAWFGLPTTRDPETLALMNEHSKLLVATDKTPADHARQAELDRMLGQRLHEYAGTAIEQLGLQAAAEIARDQAPRDTSVEREQLRAKILDRLKQKSGAANARD